MITAPYNFVPLNKEVFYPSWSEQVSHDIPFEDGESGEIEITITAKSPIFIRDHENSEQFCQHNGEYYIPSTSVKGMVRSVLEVLSFSKLRLQDKTLSYRDLNHPSYKAKAMDTNKIYMGWLLRDGQKWSIQNLGKVTEGNTRIKYTDMAKYFDKQQMEAIKKQRATAFDKYKAIGGDIKEIDNGFIVFTGSTGNKTREFLFPKAKPIRIYSFSEDDKLIHTFKEAYYIGTPNESKDWKNLWSKHFRQGKKVPIFFQLDDGGSIKHFGLSMLYKLPYEYSLQTILEKYQDFRQNNLDLAETIFGVANDGNSLKGRVFISHFRQSGKISPYKQVILPLSSPRPTFFPNYVVQCDEIGKKYTTYDNSNAILRGVKFYPHRKEMIATNEMCKKNPKICTAFTPLNSGSSFCGKIRFHNLKMSEVGALLSAITFLNTPEKSKYFHKLGMAKAYGFGSVEIKISSIKSNKGTTLECYVDSFKKTIEENLKIDLLAHPSIKALLKLSSYCYQDATLVHMPNPKDFMVAKSRFDALEEVITGGYDKSKICKNQAVQKSLQIKQQAKTATCLADKWNNR